MTRTQLTARILFFMGLSFTLAAFAIARYVLSLPWGVALLLGAMVGVYVVVVVERKGVANG